MRCERHGAKVLACGEMEDAIGRTQLRDGARHQRRQDHHDLQGKRPGSEDQGGAEPEETSRIETAPGVGEGDDDESSDTTIEY